MPSRKRAKGRERKLKQQAREPVERSVSRAPQNPNGESINFLEQIIRTAEQEENVGCDHGGFKTPQGHPVTNFINLFIETLTSENCNASTISDFMEMKFVEDKEVLEDSAMKKLVIDSIVSMGTNLIIQKYIGNARQLCRVIIILEHYCERPFHEAFSIVTEEIAYRSNAAERDVIRFYKKRIPCSCLDELYSEIKKSQDRGIGCDHCNQSIKRKDIKQCKRCKCANYCSRECQVSDWPAHKEYCKEMCSIPKNTEKERQKLQEGT